MNLVWSLLAPLAITLVVEVPVAAALGLRTRRALVAVACVSVITDPLLNLVGLALAQVWDWPASPAAALAFLVPAELLVVVVEWRLLLWALGGSSRKLLLVSAVMNAASALVGLVLWIR